MTDIPRDDVTSDDLRERLARAALSAHYPNGDVLDWMTNRTAGFIADALLPVVAEHTDAALAEQREQIVAALEEFAQPTKDYLDRLEDMGMDSVMRERVRHLRATNNMLYRAADIVREVGQP